MFGTTTFKANATLTDSGDVAAKVTAQNSYGGRSVTRSVEVVLDEKDAATVKKILSKAIDNAVVEVTVPTGEIDEATGEFARDENGRRFYETKTIPLSQQVFADAAEAFTVANNKGETV